MAIHQTCVNCRGSTKLQESCDRSRVNMINTIDFTVCDEEGFTKHEHVTFFFFFGSSYDMTWQLLNAMALQWAISTTSNGSVYLYIQFSTRNIPAGCLPPARPLWIASHQVSARVGGGGYRSCIRFSREQVWTGIQSRPQDVTSKGGTLHRGWGRGRTPFRGGPLQSEVQCIVGNGHMGPPLVNRQTNVTENITLLRLRWRAVIITEVTILDWWKTDVTYSLSLRQIIFLTELNRLYRCSKPFWGTSCKSDACK